MFERRHEPLLSRALFARRMLKSIGVAVVIDALALTLGAVSLWHLEGFAWIDAWLNAGLLITGNGPITRAQSVPGKVFVLVYAMAGVVVFAAVISSVLVPIFHRALHVFHVEVLDDTDGQARQAGETDASLKGT